MMGDKIMLLLTLFFVGETTAALVGVVRVGCEIYTADTVQQLRAIVERLERDEGANK